MPARLAPQPRRKRRLADREWLSLASGLRAASRCSEAATLPAPVGAARLQIEPRRVPGAGRFARRARSRRAAARRRSSREQQAGIMAGDRREVGRELPRPSPPAGGVAQIAGALGRPAQLVQHDAAAVRSAPAGNAWRRAAAASACRAPPANRRRGPAAAKVVRKPGASGRSVAGALGERQRRGLVAGAQCLPDQPAKPEKLGVAPIEQRGIGAPRRGRVAADVDAASAASSSTTGVSPSSASRAARHAAALRPHRRPRARPGLGSAQPRRHAGGVRRGCGETAAAAAPSRRAGKHSSHKSAANSAAQRPAPRPKCRSPSPARRSRRRRDCRRRSLRRWRHSQRPEHHQPSQPPHQPGAPSFVGAPPSCAVTRASIRRKAASAASRSRAMRSHGSAAALPGPLSPSSAAAAPARSPEPSTRWALPTAAASAVWPAPSIRRIVTSERSSRVICPPATLDRQRGHGDLRRQLAQPVGERCAAGDPGHRRSFERRRGGGDLGAVVRQRQQRAVLGLERAGNVDRLADLQQYQRQRSARVGGGGRRRRFRFETGDGGVENPRPPSTATPSRCCTGARSAAAGAGGAGFASSPAIRCVSCCSAAAVLAWSP